jgi:hypothetical protein
MGTYWFSKEAKTENDTAHTSLRIQKQDRDGGGMSSLT